MNNAKDRNGNSAGFLSFFLHFSPFTMQGGRWAKIFNFEENSFLFKLHRFWISKTNVLVQCSTVNIPLRFKFPSVWLKVSEPSPRNQFLICIQFFHSQRNVSLWTLYIKNCGYWLTHSYDYHVRVDISVHIACYNVYNNRHYKISLPEVTCLILSLTVRTKDIKSC